MRAKCLQGLIRYTSYTLSTARLKRGWKAASAVQQQSLSPQTNCKTCLKTRFKVFPSPVPLLPLWCRLLVLVDQRLHVFLPLFYPPTTETVSNLQFEGNFSALDRSTLTRKGPWEFQWQVAFCKNNPITETQKCSTFPPVEIAVSDYSEHFLSLFT